MSGKRVPELRFKGFEGDWEEKSLGSIANLTSSKRVFLSDYVSEGVPFFRGKEITLLKQGKLPDDILYISNQKYEDIKKNFGIPVVDDILITAVGTLGNVYRVRNNIPFYFKDGNLIWLQSISEYSAFLEVCIDAQKDKMLLSAIGSSQKALTIVELKKLKYRFPTLPEQQKIAGFLSDIDAKIEKLTRKKELNDQFKKGMMQRLFTVGTRGSVEAYGTVEAHGRATLPFRFRDENGNDFPEWEEKRLGEVAISISSGKSTGKEDEGEYPFWGSTGLIGYSNSHDYEGDCILVARVGANAGTLYSVKGSYCVSDNTLMLITKPTTSMNFIYFFLNYYGLQRHVFGSGQPLVTGGILKSIEICLPSLPEQQKIATFLTDLDTKLTAIDRELSLLKEFKRGLIQKMFV